MHEWLHNKPVIMDTGLEVTCGRNGDSWERHPKNRSRAIWVSGLHKRTHRVKGHVETESSCSQQKQVSYRALPEGGRPLGHHHCTCGYSSQLGPTACTLCRWNEFRTDGIEPLSKAGSSKHRLAVLEHESDLVQMKMTPLRTGRASN